ncbi:probable serine/threonine-protein kinase PIX13 [Populus alba]|uniref:probable serine/threonine-protein kinase PIX13 n=1 Tax=Populus alba TaxID=43335 RepID=UPI00158978D0|nr:probable serine/threonine-protein kinase PIX13 [Populus alba]
MGICSQPDKPKSDPVPSFIDISAVFSLKLSLKQVMHLLSVPTAGSLLQAEVNILGKLSHPNLVKLLGYCHEKEVPLVYEFMQNDCLNYHLFGKGSIQPLPWDIRLKVAVGITQGLAYLHSPEVLVIHRDLRSSNILLDKRIHNTDVTSMFWFYSSSIMQRYQILAWHQFFHLMIPVSKLVMGTYGYAAPEIMRAGRFYAKSDVFSFGVVLVEMLTGSRAIDTKRPNGKDVVVNWVIPFLSNKRKLKKKTMDTRLEGKYPIKEASLIAQFAIRCLQLEPKFRPSMKEIAETSEQIVAHQLKAT